MKQTFPSLAISFTTKLYWQGIIVTMDYAYAASKLEDIVLETSTKSHHLQDNIHRLGTL